MTNKNVAILLIIGGLIFAIIGGSLSYLSWQTGESQKTNIVFTVTADFSCAADGGGDITSEEVLIAPALCTSETYAIQREVTVSPSIFGQLAVSMDLWINVDELDDGLSESQNFMYALTTSSDSCSTGVISKGNFNGKQAGDTVLILDGKIYEQTLNDIYYLYIWLDAAETSTSTMDQYFSLSLGGSCVGSPNESNSSSGYTDSVLNGADPVLASGMIPITIAEDGTVSTANTQEEWYNYTDKEWANAVLVSETGTTNSRTYYEEKVANNEVVTIPEDDILAYYVWIPKYSYQMNGTEEAISISFNDTPSGYIEHPAFTFGSDELNGIWVGKFETSHTSSTTSSMSCTDENCANADGLIIKPNVQSLRNNTVSSFFYGARSMERSENPFGLTSSEVDTHMMKNSEWGAVAYLSHSTYGINQEIYINNSSGYYTGRSGGNVGGSVSPLATQFGDSSLSTSTQYNTYGYYTWTGLPLDTSGNLGTVTDRTLGTMASTTGNVYGVYDMVGLFPKFVMGVFANASGSLWSGNTSSYNSGFTGLVGSSGESYTGIDFPDEKYYDIYQATSDTTISATTACSGGICYGHALSETSGWYSDSATFVASGFPWFKRGGNYNNGANAGAFNFTSNNGNVYRRDVIPFQINT